MKQTWNIIIVCVTLLLLALIAAAIASAYGNQETVTVTGTAKKTVKPDRLLVNLSLTETDLDQAAAVTRLDARVKSLKDTLQSTGIDPTLLEQGQVSVYPYYDYSTSQPQPEPGKQKKQVTQNINLRLDEAKVGNIATIANSLTITIANLNPGVENYSFNYDFSNRDVIANELRSAAILNAKEKAVATVTPLGNTLGKLVSITDSGSFGGVVPMYFDKTTMSSAEPAGRSLSTSPQEQEVEFSVTASFRTKSKGILGYLGF